MNFSSLSNIFREYDIRGIVGSQLTPNFAYHLGRTFGNYLQGQGHVCIGRDVRKGAQILESNFIEGLLSTGCDVTKIGQVPIIISNFAIFNGDFVAGVYITASHNPPEYNGFRFRYPDGTGYTNENKQIKDLFFNRSQKFVTTNRGMLFQEKPEKIKEDYWSLTSKNLRNLGKLTIGIDPGNGGASKIFGDILSRAGHKIIRINDIPNENYPKRSPHNKDSELGELKSVVIKEKCDFGVALDGDGDRCVFIDDLGRSCLSEKILIVLAKHMHTLRDKKIVVSIPCSTILERELEPLGFKIIRSKVGDVHVSKELKQNNAMLGGEISSHIFITDFYFFDDSFLTTLKLAEAVIASKIPLSRLMDEIRDYPFEQTFIPCPDEIKTQLVNSIAEHYVDSDAEICQLDGIRILDDRGWILVRRSNTEPIVKVIIEGRDIDAFNEKKEEIFRVIKLKMNTLGLSMKLIEAKNA